MKFYLHNDNWDSSTFLVELVLKLIDSFVRTAGRSERCEILFLQQLVQGLFERVKTSRLGVRRSLLILDTCWLKCALAHLPCYFFHQGKK